MMPDRCYRTRWLRGIAATIVCLGALWLSPHEARAQYRGPLVFRGQVFNPVPRGNIQQSPIVQQPMNFQPIQRQAFTRDNLANDAFVFSPITRDAYNFSGGLFGPVDEGPPRAPGSSYVHPKLRAEGPSRRRPLGW